MQNSILSPASLLPDVIAIAEGGCALLRDEFHRPDGVRMHHGKPVIDHEVEVFLRDRLMALHPCAWHGEETTQAPLDKGDVWVVDPLDGTRDFCNQVRGAAMSIALLRNGWPVLGVVAAPVSPNDEGDVIAWAEGGALLRNGRPVRPRPVRDRPVVGSSADAGDYAAHNARALKGLRILACPSPARRLSLVAAGDLDAAISLVGGLQTWDIAGGHALLVGAGLVLTDTKGRPVHHNGRTFDGCLAGSAALVAQLARAPLMGALGPKRRPAKPVSPVRNNRLLSRAQGCLLGQLAGDSLGSIVEFQTKSAIARSHPEGVRDLIDGGTWNLSAGQPTDDSEMALALARSIVSASGYEEQQAASAYVDWGRSDPFDIGHTTTIGIRALASGERTRSDSQANGALMRICPVGIYAHGDPNLAARLARMDAALTHPEPVCGAANAAFAAAIAVGVGGGTPRDMAEAAELAVVRDQAGDVVRLRLEKAARAMPDDYQHQMGWVLTAFQNAFYWLMQGTPLEEAVIATVAQGGDTDTNAAICGALLGAAQGRDAIPARWAEAILTCRATEGTPRPRPMDYWPDDALSLAEALVALTR